ncbi:MAG: HEAT repeat domain-containing protein [Thermodesulfobacteriota bacterium]
MSKKKTFHEYVNELHPPKFKVWVTEKVRLDAARALGLSRNPEAAEPLILAISDKAVNDAAVKALASIPIPDAQKPAAVKALLAYAKERELDFIAAFFDVKKNPEVMALCPEQKGHPITNEPESYLAGALTMVRQLDKKKADGIEAAQAAGLDAYSRKKFRHNVRLLDKHEVFILWPEIQEIDKSIQTAEEIIASIMGKSAAGEEALATSQKGASDLPSLSEDALETFLVQGIERKASVTVAIAEVPRLVYAAADRIARDNPHVSHEEAALIAAGGITLECPHCGPIQKPLARKYLDAAGEQSRQGIPLDKAVFDRGNAGPLASGRCPECADKAAKVTLDRNWMIIPEKQQHAAAPQPAAQPAAASSFSVAYAGEMLPGVDRQAALQKLAVLFKITPEKADALFSNAPRVIKKGVDRATADKFVAALNGAGAKATVEPEN